MGVIYIESLYDDLKNNTVYIHFNLPEQLVLADITIEPNAMKKIIYHDMEERWVPLEGRFHSVFKNILEEQTCVCIISFSII